MCTVFALKLQVVSFFPTPFHFPRLTGIRQRPPQPPVDEEEGGDEDGVAVARGQRLEHRRVQGCLGRGSGESIRMLTDKPLPDQQAVGSVVCLLL